MTTAGHHHITETDSLGAANSEAFHRHLASLNAGRLSPKISGDQWSADLEAEIKVRRVETAYVERERASISSMLEGIPHDTDGFMRWFEGLKHAGPGQGDPLFPWLENECSMEQMCWFLTQEVAGEAGFDDLVALTQLRLPTQAKLELARNYWDEMGRGRPEAVHGCLLDQTVQELRLAPSIDTTVGEALALGNMMLALASNRSYAYQSIGALGVVELTAPGRVSQVCAGLKRLGISESGRRYFQLHAGLDVRHSESWNREAIRPLVSANPECAKPIAEGALLRLRCGARCFDRYRSKLMAETVLSKAA